MTKCDDEGQVILALSHASGMFLFRCVALFRRNLNTHTHILRVITPTAGGDTTERLGILGLE